jgi:hypothetical protein
MAVDSSQLNSAGRDAYWRATQAELDSARFRGDVLSLAGLGLIAALLWYFHQPGDYATLWAAGIATFALAFVALPQIFVARRRRRISAARMHCQHCGYVPHHTEISEVVSSRACPHCEKPLD